jgi:hypothetical protein
MADMQSFLAKETTHGLDGHVPGELLPLFSRCKASGFNDILFPFPNSYVDREVPSKGTQGYYEMKDKLVWREPNTAISFDRQWQGMQQQRLVHLANGLDPEQPISMLLPSSKEGSLVFENVRATELKPMAKNFDITFSAICENGSDCKEQRQEFSKAFNPTKENGGAPETDRRWEHRYVLSMDNENGPDTEFVCKHLFSSQGCPVVQFLRFRLKAL